MDIASLSTNNSTSKVLAQASMSVLKKSMDNMKENGKQMAEMISNTNVHPESTVDYRA